MRNAIPIHPEIWNKKERPKLVTRIIISDNKHLTPYAYAKLIGVSHQAIYDRIKRGTIKLTKAGRVNVQHELSRSIIKSL